MKVIDMKQKTFSSLVVDLAKLTNAGELHRISDYAQIDVDGVSFTMMEGVELGAGTASYFCDFGPLPNNSDRAEILQRLLECNLLMFGPNTPSFSINSETNHPLLMGRVELEHIEAQQLLNAFIQFSKQAKLWRQTYFLDAAKKTQTKTHRLLTSAEV
jgi:hypothetical protein